MPHKVVITPDGELHIEGEIYSDVITITIYDLIDGKTKEGKEEIHFTPELLDNFIFLVNQLKVIMNEFPEEV